MTPPEEEKHAFPPRVMVCEVEGPTPDEKCYMAEPVTMAKGSYFKEEFYIEYLSVAEAAARENAARAEAFEEVVMQINGMDCGYHHPKIHHCGICHLKEWFKARQSGEAKGD